MKKGEGSRTASLQAWWKKEMPNGGREKEHGRRELHAGACSWSVK